MHFGAFWCILVNRGGDDLEEAAERCAQAAEKQAPTPTPTWQPDGDRPTIIDSIFALLLSIPCGETWGWDVQATRISLYYGYKAVPVTLIRLVFQVDYSLIITRSK